SPRQRSGKRGVLIAWAPSPISAPATACLREEHLQATGAVMLNLYAVKDWYPSSLRFGKTINIWTYTIDRAEYFAAKSYPGRLATARAGLAERASHEQP